MCCPELTVVNVGDGACSILRCSAPQCTADIAVIDCGVWMGSHKRAALKLVDALGADLSRVRQIVVTHFDGDHWEGLRELAPLWAATVAGQPRVTVEIIYPSVPEVASRLPAGSLALISASSGTGVRATSLIAAWEAVADVVPTPVSQGARIDLAGAQHDVIWPPSVLPDSMGRGVQRALTDLEQIAGDLADQGFPGLRRNLEEAYPTAFPRHDDDEVASVSISAPTQDDVVRAGFDDYVPSDQELDRVTPAHALDMLNVGLFPDEYKQQVQELAKRLGEANNLLSLVFHDSEERRLVVFGDVERWALRECVKMTRPWYRVALAPHHGTHRVPPGFPDTHICVSQAGSQHRAKWAQHTSTHVPLGNCVSTAERGHVLARSWR